MSVHASRILAFGRKHISSFWDCPTAGPAPSDSGCLGRDVGRPHSSSSPGHQKEEWPLGSAPFVLCKRELAAQRRGWAVPGRPPLQQGCVAPSLHPGQAPEREQPPVTVWSESCPAQGGKPLSLLTSTLARTVQSTVRMHTAKQAAGRSHPEAKSLLGLLLCPVRWGGGQMRGGARGTLPSPSVPAGGRVLGAVVVRVLLQGQVKGCGAGQSRGQDAWAPLPTHTGLYVYCLLVPREAGLRGARAARRKGAETCPSSQGGRRARGARLPKLPCSET